MLPPAEIDRFPGARLLQAGNLVLTVMDPARPLAYTDTRFSPVAFVLQVWHKGVPCFFSPSPESGGVFEGGLPLEFDLGERTLPPGYEAAAPGGEFVKIGVGVLRRETDEPYLFMTPYPVVKQAVTETVWEKNRAAFRQACRSDAAGHGYRLETVLTVENNAFQMVYRLENRGRESFTTEQYVHNFVSLGGAPLGEGYAVEFPYEPECIDGSSDPEPTQIPAPFVEDKKRLVFPEKLPDGFGSSKAFFRAPGDYDSPNEVTVRHSDKGLVLTIGASRPSNNIALWVSRPQVSPEMNVLLTVAPGETVELTRTYRFADAE